MRSFYVAAVLSLLGCLCIPLVGQAGELQAELPGNDNKRPNFRDNYRNEIHFVLSAGKDPVRVFQEWCSWGYFTRWFSAQVQGGPATKYVFKRSNRKAWTKNYPATHEIKPGKFLITNVDLCDGTWTVEPDLPEKDLELRLTGYLEIKPDEETRKQKVWTGKLTVKPILIIMGKSCAAIINKIDQ
jgi:hypothetical protein